MINLKTFDIADVVLLNPQSHCDARGQFVETFRQAWLEQVLQKPVNFCQHNLVQSTRGVLRGLHFQRTPYAQAKLIQVIEGEIFDVMVDLRRSSSTFGKTLNLHLSAKTPQTLYIPAGLAHGYLVLSEQATVLYQVDQYYQPDADAGLAYNDPDLKIAWPKLSCKYHVSPKDQQQPSWKALIRDDKLFP
jgi:dTDP-4-dehydrorhamnose 3,5-epimerase